MESKFVRLESAKENTEATSGITDIGMYGRIPQDVGRGGTISRVEKAEEKT